MTSSPTPSPAPGLFARLRGFLTGEPTDGSLGSTVKPARAFELVKDGATLVDVRETSEWKSGHAPGAVHIPLGQIEKSARRLKKDRPVVVVCASGMRSRTAATKLRALGYEAASLSGGMAAWQRAGGEVRR